MMGRYNKEDFEEIQVTNKPPMVKETLQSEIRFLRQKLRGKFPSEIPRDSEDAALWWMTRQKPANDLTERPHQVSVTGKQEARWINPYADRLISSLRRFVMLKAQQRQFVLAAVEDKVWYNGDSFEFFMRVYEETMTMRAVGVEQYRKQAKKKLGSLLRGI